MTSCFLMSPLHRKYQHRQCMLCLHVWFMPGMIHMTTCAPVLGVSRVFDYSAERTLRHPAASTPNDKMGFPPYVPS